MKVTWGAHCFVRLHVSSPVDDMTSRGGNVDGVEDGPQHLPERPGEETRVSLMFRAEVKQNALS